MVAYTNHALMAWPLRHYTYTYTPDYDNARLRVAVITRATANGRGYPTNAVGVNEWRGAYISGTGSYGGFTKNIITVPRYQTFLIWDSTTMHFGTNQWRNVSAHEHGQGIPFREQHNDATTRGQTTHEKHVYNRLEVRKEE